jgi:cell division septum initiation protein DivIVA
VTVELTEKQKASRRKKAAQTITRALQQAHHEWHRLNDGDWRLIGDIAVDALGDLAAEILTDGTMLRSLTIENGVATLSLEPATEILKIFVASMRGVLDGYGAENYLETEMQAPSISMDLRDGDNPMDSYTVTIQRRTRPTPHEFRQKAEARVAAVLAECDALEAEVYGQHDEDDDGIREAVRRIRARAQEASDA